MADIHFRCDDELKQLLEEAARQVDMKPSELARMIIAKGLKYKTAVEDSSSISAPKVKGEGEWGGDAEPKSVLVATRLTPTEDRAITVRANAMGMKKGTWIMRLVRAHLTKNPQLSSDEVAALREASRELSYVGRNLNQVAHAFNMNANAQHKVPAALVTEANGKVDNMRARIKAVLDENVYRWLGDR